MVEVYLHIQLCMHLIEGYIHVVEMYIHLTELYIHLINIYTILIEVYIHLMSYSLYSTPVEKKCSTKWRVFYTSTPSLIRRENEVIHLPLYHTNDREKILAFVDVPASGGDENKWLKAGIVLYINIPE